MTARRKSVLNVILAAIALLAIIVGTSFITQTAKADSSVTFEQGAYIRIDTDHGAAESTTGIRFKATADSSVWNAKEAGMIIMPSSVVAKFDAQTETGISDLFEYCSVKYGKTKDDISKPISRAELEAKNGEMVASIVGIKDDNFKSEYTAIAYSYDGSAYTYYRSGIERTIIGVANKAFAANSALAESDENKLTAAQKEELTEIIKRAIKLELGTDKISKTLAIGKTVDLGKVFTDAAITEGVVTYSVKSGNETVKLGTDNLQAIASGTAVLSVSAYKGDLAFEAEIVGKEGTSVEEICDFVIEAPAGKDVKVLQITDTQFENYDKVSHGAATADNLFDVYTEANFGKNALDYIQKAFDSVKPDFIIMTGDNVFGRFDPDGTAFRALVDKLDSLKTPWAAVYGNHDNESEMGALWQNEQLSNSKYGMFLQGVTDGNGNYTVGIKQNGTVKRVFCMMDTNACELAHEAEANHVTTTTGFTDDQIAWFKRTLSAIKEADATVKVSMAYHVPNYAFVQAKEQYADAEADVDTYYYTLGLDVAAKAGDFGSYNVINSDTFATFDYNKDSGEKKYDNETLLTIFKNNGVDSVFCGHEHQISTSIVYEGIRWTFGLKTGVYDIPEKDNLGGTAITIDKDGGVSVAHVYNSLTYQAYKDEIRNGTYTNTDKMPPAGLTVMSKSNNTISPQDVQKGTVTKEIIGGFGAYKLSADRQCDFKLDPSLIESGESVTFSYYVPPTNKGFYNDNWRSFGIDRGVSENHYFLQRGGGGTFGTDYEYFDNFDTWYTATVPLKVNDTKVSKFNWVISKGGEVYIKDVTVNKGKTTTGNIAPTAATANAEGKKIVSSFEPYNPPTCYSQVFNYEGKLHFWSHINTINHMVFDSDFVQNCYNSGLTKITFTFYLATGFIATGSSLYFGYLDSSNTMQYFMNGNAYLGVTPIKPDYVGFENRTTASFTLTKEMYEKIDFANGARFVLGYLEAGSNDPLKMIITHLEFSTPKA